MAGVEWFEWGTVEYPIQEKGPSMSFLPGGVTRQDLKMGSRPAAAAMPSSKQIAAGLGLLAYVLVTDHV